MAEKSKPDYYRILQVHPQAEQEVIDAAYRRLMRKYHPDMLSPEERDNVEVQKLARSINEAYRILSDSQARASYDAEYLRPAPQQPTRPQKPPVAASVEQREVPARCSKREQRFAIQLARRKNSDEAWHVVGFELVEANTGSKGTKIVKTGSARGFIEHRFGLMVPPEKPLGFGTLSDEELEALFDDSNKLAFADIHWAGRVCPVCSSKAEGPDRAPFSWFICGTCFRISCMGGASMEDGIWRVTCLWCKARMRIDKPDASGLKTEYIVGGDDGLPARPQLKSRPGPTKPDASLPDGKKKSLPSS